VGRIYYDDKQDHILEEDIEQAIRDVAAQGRITIWGRPDTSMAILNPPAEVAIPQIEWPRLSLDLTTMDGSAPNGVCARAHGQNQYYRLRADRREIYREWPRASYVSLLLDKTWKSRRLKAT
jgi:hypothetical protein